MIRLTRRMLMLGALVACVVPSAAGRAYAEQEYYQDGFTVMVSVPQFTRWTNLMADAEMGDAETHALLTGERPFTLLAPTNDALERYSRLVDSLLPTDDLALPRSDRLIAFIKGHFCKGVYPISEFFGQRGNLRTMAGTTVSFDGTQPDAIRVTWANLLGRQLEAKLVGRPLRVLNGRIYTMADPLLSDCWAREGAKSLRASRQNIRTAALLARG
jgi:uncharacterized surface protein with fasciclin (FAS1) repeats